MQQTTYRALRSYFLGFALVFAFRLLPFRPPNVEPVMATMMPFAKHYGAVGGFLFGALSIVLFDVVTSGLGIWTLITALVYGGLGAAAYLWFKDRASTGKNYALFAIVSTLVYDAATGLTIGPLLWGQPFMVALVGQIPFTMLHLIGNVTLAYFVSPLIYRYVIRAHEPTVPHTISVQTSPR